MTIKAPAEDSSLDFEASEKICKREESFREISANFSRKSSKYVKYREGLYSETTESNDCSRDRPALVRSILVVC